MSEKNNSALRPWVCRMSQPGVWYIDEAEFGEHGFIATCWASGQGDHVAEANAKLIVRAVNNFDVLREALYDAILQIQYLKEKFGEMGMSNAVIARAAAVLAAAEGGDNG